MVTQTRLFFDGTKAIPLNKLPPEAWDVSGGSDTDSQATTLYGLQGWLFRCVQIRANTMAGLPWAVVRNQNDLWTSDDDTPPQYELLDRLDSMLWLTEAALSLTGEAFWLKERNRVRTVGLRWLAPSTMVPQWSASSGLTGFKRTLGRGEYTMLAPEEVVYFALPNPLHETKPGVAPAAAASAAAGVLYSVDRFVAGFFDRGAIKATLLTVEGATIQAEMEKLEAWWKRFFRGVSSAWESAAVRAGVTPVTIGEGIGELSNTALTQEQREAISTALGVPHSLVMSNAANYATSQQDEVNFYNQTIIPESRIVARAINDQLMAELGLRLQFRPQEMAVFQEDEEQRAGSLLNLVNAKVPLDIALAILGFDLSDDEMLRIQQQVAEPPPMPVTIEAAPSPAQLPADDAAKAADLERFKRWAAKRRGKRPDPDDFSSEYLTYEQKAAILYEQAQGDADGGDARFHLADWAAYP